MEPKDCPRLEFGLQEGQLAYRLVSWWERPGLDDVHIEGRSHFVYGDWRPITSIGLDDEVPEVVMDKVIELMTDNL